MVRGDRVVAAGVTLPLSESVETYQLGTRHKAALGITESSDALAVVVSEERGTIAVAYNGQIAQRVSVERLRTTLQTAAMAGPSRDVLKSLGMTNDKNA